MANNTLTATVATVKLGHLEFEGLMFEDGSYGISITQINELISFSTHNNYISQTLKRLMGAGFSTHKVKTDLYRQLINAVDLVGFEKLLRKLDRNGNKAAQEITDELIGLSLTQLFSDAFGKKFEKDERQNYLISRQLGKVTRRKMTDCIKSWCDRNEVPGKIQAYCIYCSDALNIQVFGKKAKQLREERAVSNNDLLRDTFTSDELRRVEAIEDKVILLTDTMNIKPTDAIKQVLAANGIK